MSTFEIYSQSEMLPKDSTNNLSGKIAARVESVDMAKRGGPAVLIDLRLGVGSVRELNYLPVEAVSEFTLFPSGDSK